MTPTNAGVRDMTTPTEYRQARNDKAREHGGPFVCPHCNHAIDRTDGMYHCQPCNFYWSPDGQIIEGTP